MQNTKAQYQAVIEICRKVFVKKNQDYGTSWRVLRLSSLTDQIFIKAQRIRTVQETGENKVGEELSGEFKAIVNYCIMALIQIELKETDAPEDMLPDLALKHYNKVVKETEVLMMKKNHDYGEAWRDMRIASLVDLILVKLLRIKQIEDNMGRTVISEGVDSNYADILNYAVFALIKMSEIDEVL